MTSDYSSIRPETKNMIDGSESIDVEFKQSLSGLTSSDLVAFANAYGGTIFLGVREEIDSSGMKHGVIVGLRGDFDRDRGSIISKATSCRPPIDLTVARERANGNYIYRIDVEVAVVKPCCTNSGRYVIRDEGVTKPIDPSTMTALIIERESENFITRLEQSGETFIEVLKEGQSELSKQINAVQEAAEEAQSAAENAEWAASQAEEAARQAAELAEEAVEKD